ncbi:MAG: hypothetical protein LBH25_00020 [Fibromonadaceae bacterium]|nr:hypothetical protein [Fibromonadaceae bacterium]
MNDRFNYELEQQIDGSLPKGHIYELGKPGQILRKAGVPDLPIELNAATLAKKSNPNYKNSHPFDLSEVKDLPQAIQDPIMIFDSKTRADSKVILTELKSNGVNFVVAMEMSRKKGSIEVNSIRSIYPKDNIAHWIEDGLLKYENKEKASASMNERRSNSAEVTHEAEASTNKYTKFSEEAAEKSEKNTHFQRKLSEPRYPRLKD